MGPRSMTRSLMRNGYGMRSSKSDVISSRHLGLGFFAGESNIDVVGNRFNVISRLFLIAPWACFSLFSFKR